MTGNKIIIVHNTTTGLHLFRKKLVERLIEKGYSVSAIGPDDGAGEAFRAMGLKIIDLPMDRRGINPIKDLKLIRQYAKLMRIENPDLVINYTVKPDIYASIVARFQRRPYAANITGLGSALEQDSLLQKFVKLLYRFSLQKAKVVFFENSSNKDFFVQNHMIKENQVKVLHGAGVDLKHFSYQEYPSGEGRFNFLFIGRVMKEKGIEELLSSLERLVSEGYSLELHILGFYEETAYKERVNRYEKDGWIYFHGFQRDVRPYIKNCDCFVLPSYHEGMANTNLECAASGRPLITSNIPGCKEAVVENVTGLLCSPQDVDSLYVSLKRMLQMSREEREAMGKAGRIHMEEVFDKEKVVNETLNCLLS